MKALDREIGALHGRYWDSEQQAARGKQVLLVEGDDDRDVVEAILRQRRTTWETRVRVVVAGGRTRVRERADFFPHAQLLVDRDTWTDDEIPRADNLHVTAGWCLENLFLAPEFLHTIDPRIAATVAASRDSWVRAGALWWTLQRTIEAQQRWKTILGGTYGALHQSLDLQSAATLRDTLAARIPEHIRVAASLDLDLLAATFEARLQQILALPESRQWQLGVHGKEAFRHLLHPALQQAHGRRNWRVELASRLDRPPPFDTLLPLLLL
jgi:hypothetical protein